MLPNPYVLLAALLAFLAVGFGGYRYGYSRAEDAVAARVATAQNEAITAANAETAAAVARTLEQAKAEAAARLRSTKARLEGERDAIAKAKPDCARDADSQRLLLDAIDLANGTQADPNTMLDAVRPTSQPSK